MPGPSAQTAANRMARDVVGTIGHEVALARANLGLSGRAVARLAGVSPATQRRVEAGRPTVAVHLICRVANAVGLKVWGKAFPVREPSLRDTGQLELADVVRGEVAGSSRVVIELGLGNGRSIDMAVFTPSEILAIEIFRRITDFQAQYRSADAKRIELAAGHQRSVHLVLALEDSRLNRRVLRDHERIVRASLPATPRAVMTALRTGRPLGADGLVWLRRHQRTAG